MINSSNQGSTTLRNVPDLSAEADCDNWWCAQGTCQGGIGGTSLSTPRWAGFMALVNEQAALKNAPSVGFLNPTVYGLGTGSNYDSLFHDITSGSNNNGLGQQYDAVTGYDLVTGWGSPNGQALISTLTPPSTAPYFTLSATPSTLTVPPGAAGTTSTIQLASGNNFSRDSRSGREHSRSAARRYSDPQSNLHIRFRHIHSNCLTDRIWPRREPRGRCHRHKRWRSPDPAGLSHPGAADLLALGFSRYGLSQPGWDRDLNRDGCASEWL